MDRVYNKISQQLEETSDVDVLALYQALQPIFIYDFLEVIYKVVDLHHPRLKKKLLLTDAQTVLKQLSPIADDTQRLTAQCNKLTVLGFVAEFSLTTRALIFRYN